MNAAIERLACGESPGPACSRLVLDISIKAALVCAVAGARDPLMRRSVRRAREAWSGCSPSPFFSRCRSRSSSPRSGIFRSSPRWAAGSGRAHRDEARRHSRREDRSTPRIGAAAAATRAAPHGGGRPARFAEGWHAWAFLVWMAGAALSASGSPCAPRSGGRILGRCDAADEEWDGSPLETCRHGARPGPARASFRVVRDRSRGNHRSDQSGDSCPGRLVGVVRREAPLHTRPTSLPTSSGGTGSSRCSRSSSRASTGSTLSSGWR